MVSVVIAVFTAKVVQRLNTENIHKSVVYYFGGVSTYNSFFYLLILVYIFSSECDSL